MHMHVLETEWRGGYPQYHRHCGEVLIRPSGWIRLKPIDNLFIRPERSLRKVFYYIQIHGLMQTFRKIKSRLAERGRNQKYLVFGWGKITESGATSGFVPGTIVGFIAPCHPACVDSVAIDKRLVLQASSDTELPSYDSKILHGDIPWPIPSSWERVAGWSPFSGLPIDADLVQQILDQLLRKVAQGQFEKSLHPLPTKPDPSARSRGQTPQPDFRPSAVLFGYGQYAKAIILPRVSPHVNVQRIHEIDPTQLGRVSEHRRELRTSAFPDPGDDYDVYLIAGYHHTHTEIAEHCLRRGATAVVEKPLATTSDQLHRVLDASSTGAGRLFVAFQRRYTKFRSYLARDLELNSRSPVHCHCLVYEIPTPAKHWYRWPNSRSRIVSNGCHWIDLFLFLNNYQDPQSIEASRRPNGDVIVLIDLPNGASFSMLLTEHGSSRLGVRDHIEIRTRDRTALMIDQRIYRSETHSRVLCSDRISAREPYDSMYGTIGRNIVSGAPGDSLASLRVTTETMLTADDQICY